MSSISPVSTFPSHWNTPDEELNRWSPENALGHKFEKNIAALILEYSDSDICKKISACFNRLKLINALPKKIPPLCQNIMQILESDCWIDGTPKKIGDCFSLYLIPAGTVPACFIKTIDDIAQLCGMDLKQKYLENYSGRFFSLRTPETVGFESSEWILVSELIPESTEKTLEEQKKIIKGLVKKFLLNYPNLICEFPRFKYVMAANLLKIRSDGVGHWIQKGEGKGTRVQECFADPCEVYSLDPSSSGREQSWEWEYFQVFTLCFRSSQHVADYDRALYKERLSNIGVAAVIRGLSFEPKEASCSVS